MRKNKGWACVPGWAVADVVSGTASRMVTRHPGLDVSVVDTVVYQAAVELVSTVADAEQLSRMLLRRADARLAAMGGAPVAIGSTTVR
jgi:hypothetical protein